MAPADLLVLTVLGIAALRGLLLGLVREVLSLVSLAAAFVAVRFLAVPAGSRLDALVGGGLGSMLATVLAGAGVVVGVLVAGAVAARVARRGARAAGLGWLDKTAGTLLGAAEGALVVAAVLMVSAGFLGRDHAFLAESRAFAALEELERAAREGSAQGLPPVAAPPEREGEPERER